MSKTNEQVRRDFSKLFRQHPNGQEILEEDVVVLRWDDIENFNDWWLALRTADRRELVELIENHENPFLDDSIDWRFKRGYEEAKTIILAIIKGE